MAAVPRLESGRTTQVSDVPAPMSGGRSDLLINNLAYVQPKALSLATNRTYRRQEFQKRDYTEGEIGICVWNTGTSYSQNQNGYLTFRVTARGSGEVFANFGSGSAMNLIRTVVIKSRSGTELDRRDRANLFSRTDSRYKYNDQYLDGAGSVQGFAAFGDTSVVRALSSSRFCIPLGMLSGLFDPLKGQPLPPQLASGLQIELTFERFETALIEVAGSPTALTGYDISDIRFVVDSLDMTDDTQKVINMESASNGLEYAYERVHTAVSQVPTGQLNNNIQIQKAVSQACMAVTMVVDTSQLINKDADSMRSRVYDTTSFQYRLGSLYFPSQVISDPTLDGAEAFVIAQQTYDKLKHRHAENSIDVGEFKNSLSTASVSLEKDTNLNMSGLPVNNSRLLELNINFDAVSAPREIITFLTYCSVARSFIDNVAVAL